jgi:protein involved in polysaccharide export with SLBB domain
MNKFIRSSFFLVVILCSKVFTQVVDISQLTPEQIQQYKAFKRQEKNEQPLPKNEANAVSTEFVQNDLEANATPILGSTGGVEKTDTTLGIMGGVEKSDTTSSKTKRFVHKYFRNVNPNLFKNTASAVGRDYVLKSKDQLLLIIWGGQESEQRLEINRHGAVFVKGVGLVSVAGKTISSAEKVIRRKLANTIVGIDIGTTEVKLQLEAISPIEVFVLGQIKTPGGYSFHGNSNVFAALYLAGGPTMLGSVRKIKVLRGRKKFTVDLYEFLFEGKKTKSYYLKDGDVILIPPIEKMVTLSGEVGETAAFELKEKEGIRNLIHWSGGVQANVANQSVKIHRITKDGIPDLIEPGSLSSILESKKHVAIFNGDSILIPKSNEKFEQWITVDGEVKYPGIYKWNKGYDLNKIIEISGGFTDKAAIDQIQLLRKDPSRKTTIKTLNKNEVINIQAQDIITVSNIDNTTIIDTVYIRGAIKNANPYILHKGMTLKDLIVLAGGYTNGFDSVNTTIERIAENERIKVLSGKKVFVTKLKPFDRVKIPFLPFYGKQLVVSLGGATHSQGRYSTIVKGETLKSFVQRLGGLKAEAYLKGGKFFRVRKINQKKYRIAIDLEKAILGDSKHDISLQSGDSIYIPKKTISVQVYGDVVGPTDVLWEPGQDMNWYLNQAGGLTISGDEDRIVITYANGQKSNIGEVERQPDPGSKIFVPYKDPPEPTDWVKVWGAVAQTVSGLVLIFVTISAL